MTKVIISQNDDLIETVEVNDHASFAKNGEDIVCAGISSVVFGTLNALVKFGLYEGNIIINDASIKIIAFKGVLIQTALRTMIIQLQTIQDSYPDYIEILIK